MVILIRRIVLFGLVVTLMVSGSTRSQDAGREMSLHEKAVHHYDQLVRTLIEIQKTGVGNLPTALIAAAASGNDKNKSDDVSPLILRCLLASHPTVQNIGDGSVTNINIFNNATVNFSLRDKKKKSDKKSTVKGKGVDGSSIDGEQPSSEIRPIMAKSSLELSPWMKNLVRPLNFTIKREGELIRVNFDVSRTEPAAVSRAWTFDGEKKYLKGPTDYGLDAGLPITSPIGFVFNSSGCPPKASSRPRRESFAFSKKSTNLDTVTFIMPTCILDVLNGMRENREENEIEWNEPEDQYAQALYYPDYWNKMNTSIIHTVSGKNVTFDMEVALAEEDHIMIEGYFYNATSDSTILADNLFLQLSNRAIRVHSFDSPDQVKLFDVKVLNQNQINASIPGMEYKELNDKDTVYHVSATLRVIIMTANEDVSGMLYIQNQMSLPVLSKRRLPSSIMSLNVMKAVQILRPNGTEAIPKGKYITHSKREFRCDDQGFSYHQGYGDNCTFFCSIVATNLKSIRVRKVSGGIAPVQKYAEVNSHNAIVFVNLGPARKEIDGEYECRAIEIGGKKHRWKVTVGTWGFPIMNETTLEVLNDSATFVCVVHSERPVNLFTSLHTGSQARRIDGEANVTRSLEKRGDETRMEVTIPTSYLRWPNEFLACNAKNEAGSDMSMTMLSPDRIPDYYYQTSHPFLLRDESFVKDHRDGAATVKCVATGKDPLDINFYFDPYSNEELVKNNSMNSITTQRDGDKTTTILKMPTASLSWPRYTISCRAKNEYGEDSMNFELANFIHEYYY